MKLLSTIAILLFFIAAAPNQDDFPAKKGWKSLFDGKSKKGWHIYRGEATGESWQVEDEWNQAEVIYNNNTLQLILNGETVVSTTVGDENWDKLVAGSKFRTMKGFGTFRKGRIVLQDHGDKVWYRNIKLKQL